MKALKYLNKYFLKYKYRLLIGLFITFCSKYLALQIPQLISKSLDASQDYKNGLITDTSIANIAIEIDGIWFTPKTPLLYGTTRQRYLDNSKLKELDISIEMLQSANKIGLLNAMIDFDVLDDYKILI